jgi:hypothetical protein
MIASGENYELRADLNSEYADVRKDGVKRVSMGFEASCLVGIWMSQEIEKLSGSLVVFGSRSLPI